MKRNKDNPLAKGMRRRINATKRRLTPAELDDFNQRLRLSEDFFSYAMYFATEKSIPPKKRINMVTGQPMPMDDKELNHQINALKTAFREKGREVQTIIHKTLDNPK